MADQPLHQYGWPVSTPHVFRKQHYLPAHLCCVCVRDSADYGVEVSEHGWPSGGSVYVPLHCDMVKAGR